MDVSHPFHVEHPPLHGPGKWGGLGDLGTALAIAKRPHMLVGRWLQPGATSCDGKGNNRDLGDAAVTTLGIVHDLVYAQLVAADDAPGDDALELARDRLFEHLHHMVSSMPLSLPLRGEWFRLHRENNVKKTAVEWELFEAGWSALQKVRVHYSARARPIEAAAGRERFIALSFFSLAWPAVFHGFAIPALELW